MSAAPGRHGCPNGLRDAVPRSVCCRRGWPGGASDSIVDRVSRTMPTIGAGLCPPGGLGPAIGGMAGESPVLAREALVDAIDIRELRSSCARAGESERGDRDLESGRGAAPRRPHALGPDAAPWTLRERVETGEGRIESVDRRERILYRVGPAESVRLIGSTLSTGAPRIGARLPLEPLFEARCGRRRAS